MLQFPDQIPNSTPGHLERAMIDSDKAPEGEGGSVASASGLVSPERPQHKATPSGILKIPLPSFAKTTSSNHHHRQVSTEGYESVSSPSRTETHNHHIQRKVSTKRLRGRPPIAPINPGSDGANSALATSTHHQTPARAGPSSSLLLESLERSHKTLVEELIKWIYNEHDRRRAAKAKREAKKLQRNKKGEQEEGSDGSITEDNIRGGIIPSVNGEDRTPSERPSSDFSSSGSYDESLNRLERIILENLGPGVSPESLSLIHKDQNPKRPSLPRKASSGKIKPPLTPKTGGRTSDTEIGIDGDVNVPSCEVHLVIPEKIGMDSFKSEVLKLAHTLRCKGWRRIDLRGYKSIDIQRISGALTNAVYMVSPPADFSSLASRKANVDSLNGTISSSTSTRRPQRLLLRIYGPQVSHLIDREVELSILRRLARKKIGPRLLGTFENGRFEQFFNAKPLTRDDIRVPETSRQIAKRMRELHEGMELEEEERRMGPVVWLNWNKWIKRTREVMKVIDAETEKEEGEYLCGLSWPEFENTVERYRIWQTQKHGGIEEIKKRLVFAHNDTQYGNILRIIPSGDSPLLLPSNEHKQLVVIDFEYASANVPGYEFANHFCEWMANYHNSRKPHTLRESDYPTLEQQRLFIRAYVGHRLFTTPHPLTRAISTTNSLTSMTAAGAARSQSRAFSLDSGIPASEYNKEEAARQAQTEKDTQRLLEETNVWRPASNAVWCAWGIVQARLDDFYTPAETEQDKSRSKKADKQSEEEAHTHTEFSYLAYAQQRALLFLGDMLQLGIMKEEELGQKVVGKVKRVKF